MTERGRFLLDSGIGAGYHLASSRFSHLGVAVPIDNVRVGF